jgi:hypothetical protein
VGPSRARAEVVSPLPLEPEPARLLLGLSIAQLWIDYVGLGGSAPPMALRRFLKGGAPLGRHDQDLVAQALNERFADLGREQRVAFSSPGAAALG